LSIQNNLTERRELVKSGIDILMDLFDLVYWQKQFPRKMATAQSQGKQFTVYSREEILRKCSVAKYKDCRLNAYPTMGDSDMKKGYMAPSILFIDIDKGENRTEEEITIILEETLAKIKETFGISPLVLYTGNGYHIYIGLKARPLFTHLELMKRCREMGTEPNREFIRFAGGYFTDNRSDPQRDRGLSQKSALLRIPYTLNGKCLEEGRDPIVKVVQKHSEKPAQMNEALFSDFELYIANMWIHRDRLKNSSAYNDEDDDEDWSFSNDENDDWDNEEEDDGEYHGEIDWIEDLLQTPISKNRYFCLWRIIGPYLRHTLQLSKKDARARMMQWLELSNKKSTVKNVQTKLAGALSSSHNWAPISLKKLRKLNEEENFEYQEILDAMDQYANEDSEEEGEEDD
jgi:hypothetical protein